MPKVASTPSSVLLLLSSIVPPSVMPAIPALAS